jgi:ABC-2 type transport system permease protein
MSTSSTATQSSIAPSEGRSAMASFPRLLASEWTKLRSVRSTLWAFGIMIVAVLGFTALFMSLTVSQWDKSDAEQKAAILRDPAGQILGSGFFLGQLAVCVLGVMVVTSEYSTGMIRASLLAVPKRIPMLAAKALVFAATVFVIGEILTFGAFFIGAPILHSKAPVALGDAGVLRAVIGGGLYLTVLGLFAMAIGALVRHTAGGITGIIGFVLVLAPLAQLLPGSIGKHIHAYLPTEAGHLIAQSRQGTKDLLTPLQGFGVFCLWTAVGLIVAGYLLKRRDA